MRATCSAPAGIGSSIIKYCARGPVRRSLTTIMSPERSSPLNGSTFQLAFPFTSSETRSRRYSRVIFNPPANFAALFPNRYSLCVGGVTGAHVLSRNFDSVQINFERVVGRQFLTHFQVPE